MADKLNANGAPNLEQSIFLPTIAGSATHSFETGDMLFWDETNITVKPASDFTFDSNENLTRQQFKRRYAGVAADRQIDGDPARLVKVFNIAEVAVTATSAIMKIAAEGGLSLVGPEKASGSNLENKKVEVTGDPTEAIGMIIRNRTTAGTKARAILIGQVCGMGVADKITSRVAAFHIGDMNSAIDWLTDVDPVDIFGGAVELLSIAMLETIAVTVGDNVITIDKVATPLGTTLTVPSAGAAIGRLTTQDLTGDAARFFPKKHVTRLKTMSS